MFPDDEERAREGTHLVSQRLKLGEIVLRAGVIDQLQLQSALGEQEKWGGRLGVVLIKLGYVTEQELVNAVAGQLGLPVATLDGKQIPRRILDLIPYDYADDHTCLPLFLKDEEGTETLYVGMDDPSNLEVLDDLAFRTGMRVKPVVVAASEICEGIDRFYRDLERDSTPDEVEITQPEVENVLAAASRDTSPFETEKPVCFEPAEETLHLEDEAVEAPKRSADDAGDEKGVENNDHLSTHMLLQALTQVLIEKGVLTREEFHERVLALSGEGGPEKD